MKTYQQFIRGIYYRSSTLKKYYGSLGEYQDHYIQTHGFTEWLESLRGAKLTMRLTYSVVRAFLRQGKRNPIDIPSVLGSISRQYGVEIPVREGILTEKFWVDTCTNFGWLTEDKANSDDKPVMLTNESDQEVSVRKIIIDTILNIQSGVGVSTIARHSRVDTTSEHLRAIEYECNEMVTNGILVAIDERSKPDGLFYFDLN